MTVDQLIARAAQRGVTCAPRDGRWVIIGIRRLSKRKQAELRAALASKPPALDAHRVAPPAVSPREPARARPAPELEPELFVGPGGRRVAEANVIEALSMLGDEQVQAYRDGRLPKVEAYRIARDRLRTIARMSAGRYIGRRSVASGSGTV